MTKKVARQMDPGARRPAWQGAPEPTAEEALRLRFDLEERLRFETLLADLSTTFVSVPADGIDAHIEGALRRMTQFLEIDRSSLGEYQEAECRFLVTHSYVEPGIEPMPCVIADGQLPWYAEKIRQGQVLCFARLPDDLPPEAVNERVYVTNAGMKSNRSRSRVLWSV